MKSWRVHAWGEPESMVLEDVPEPQPGKGQVRIRVRAAALNFFDVLQVQGKYQVKPPFPFTPGAEVSGEIEVVGKDIKDWRTGDRVVAMPMAAAFAERVVADAI